MCIQFSMEQVRIMEIKFCPTVKFMFGASTFSEKKWTKFSAISQKINI